MTTDAPHDRWRVERWGRNGQRGKLLAQMRNNPRGDWTIEDIERLCRSCGIAVDAPKRGSHYTLGVPGSGLRLTVPARRPIKPFYILQVVKLVDAVLGDPHER